MNNTRPHWLPRGLKRNVKLTSEQYNYILPAFTRCRGSSGHKKPLDGVSLCDNVITGHRLAIKELLKRFEFSDLDVTNLTEATLP
jgi:hypothetical protein